MAPVEIVDLPIKDGDFPINNTMKMVIYSGFTMIYLLKMVIFQFANCRFYQRLFVV
jgi:hypothetical protein